MSTIDSIEKSKSDESNIKDDRQHPESIVAAIDIGTNSIHMVIARVDPKLPAFTIIAKEKDTVRLGEKDPKTGNLTKVAMDRAFAALERCQELASSLNADRIIAVATSAVREAPNGRNFIQKIALKLGLYVDLISGVEEARRIYLGVLSALEFDQQPHIIIDIGGGSTEIILADDRDARFLSSTKIGAVRLTEDLVKSDPINHEDFKNLRAHIKGMLERPIERLRAELKQDEIPRLVGTSGTIETLATIHALKNLGSTPNPLNGYKITYKDVENIVASLAKMNYSERFATPGISDKRAEIILAGATILLEAMSLLKTDSLVVCERSLREGIIVNWMLDRGLIASRLGYQSQVRARSVMKIAYKYQVELDYSQRIANFAVDLFERTAGMLHNWDYSYRQLLWAAAILHNCGVYISHSAHHKHSYYLIRHAELLGFTELDLEIIANIARYHRKSKPKKKHDNYQKLPDKQSRHLVSELSAMLRIAVALDRRKIGAIKGLKCEYDRDRKILYLHLIPSFPNDDCALELWSLNYKKQPFEEEYGVAVLSLLDSFTPGLN